MFIQIIVQQKGLNDFRSFAICRDSSGVKWELMGCGQTPGQAADYAFEAYQSGEDNWDLYGYAVGEGD